MQRSVSIDLSMLKNVTWWSWVTMIVLLVIRFNGYPSAAVAAIVICGGLAGYDLLQRRGDFAAMGVQIRLGYVFLLIVGMIPGLEGMHAVQIIGTTARVITGYCLLERELLMMPWNHAGWISVDGMLRILIARPGAGGIFRFDGGGTVRASACEIGGSAQRETVLSAVPDAS